MLHPEYFEHAADDILTIYEKLDDSIIEEICAEISKYGKLGKLSKWQAERIQEAGLIYDKVISLIGKQLNKSDEAIKRLFEEAAVESIKIDDGIYEKAGLSPIPLLQSKTMLETLQAGLEKTGGIMHNLTLTTANAAQQAYINACDLAYMQITSGAMDYNRAFELAIKNAINDCSMVLYPSGHRDQLDVAIRRAVLTGINQTSAKAQIIRMDELGCDLVETTAHGGARPSHAEWQGRVFSRSGSSRKYPDFVSSTGYGTGAGLCGWNCRHSFYPYFDGISTPSYSSQQLRYYNRIVGEYNGKKYNEYEASQVQRAFERKIRAIKRQMVGFAEAKQENQYLQTIYIDLAAMLDQKTEEMNAFLKAVKRLKDITRLKVNNYDL